MSLVNFNLSIDENNQEVPYSEQLHRFTDHLLIKVTNIHSIVDRAVSPIFYMHGFQSVVELSKNANSSKCGKNSTRLAIKMVRPLDSVVSAVLNEETTVLVDSNKLVKFTLTDGQYTVTCKKSKSPLEDSVVFKVHVQSNAPVAMVHRSDYSLNKLPLNRECSDLTKTAEWFLNEHLADISFKCTNRKTNSTVKYPGHRMILSSLSSSMRTLLQKSLSIGVAEINLTEYSSESVHSLLRLLYTGQLMIDANHLRETLDLLNNYCSTGSAWPSIMHKLFSLVSASTVLALYEFTASKATESVEVLQLRDYCLSFIDANADVVLTDGSFASINKSTLGKILQRDTLITRESTLFNALNDWSKNQCAINSVEVTPSNQLRYIGDGIKYIRFNAMTAKEFASGPALSGLVTNNDTIRFLMQVANSQAVLNVPGIFGKPRNQQIGWTNGLLDITTTAEEEEEEEEKASVASAPSVNQLNKLATSFDDNIELKLNLMYPTLNQ